MLSLNRKQPAESKIECRAESGELSFQYVFHDCSGWQCKVIKSVNQRKLIHLISHPKFSWSFSVNNKIGYLQISMFLITNMSCSLQWFLPCKISKNQIALRSPSNRKTLSEYESCVSKMLCNWGGGQHSWHCLRGHKSLQPRKARQPQPAPAVNWRVLHQKHLIMRASKFKNGD